MSPQRIFAATGETARWVSGSRFSTTRYTNLIGDALHAGDDDLLPVRLQGLLLPGPCRPELLRLQQGRPLQAVAREHLLDVLAEHRPVYVVRVRARLVTAEQGQTLLTGT